MQNYNYHQVQHYSAKQIFDLVMDIEKYPEFLPWVSNVKILSSKDNIIMAELLVSFKGFGYSYVSEVTFRQGGQHYYITAKANNGPFQCLSSQWAISEIDDKTCKIDFAIKFQFKSPLLYKFIGDIFEQTAQKMLDNFAKRAESIYR